MLNFSKKICVCYGEYVVNNQISVEIYTCTFVHKKSLLNKELAILIQSLLS